MLCMADVSRSFNSGLTRSTGTEVTASAEAASAKAPEEGERRMGDDAARTGAADAPSMMGWRMDCASRRHIPATSVCMWNRNATCGRRNESIGCPATPTDGSSINAIQKE